MSELVWEDPPADPRGHGQGLAEKRQAMQEHPGKWLVIRADAVDLSEGTRLRHQGFETTGRRNADRRTYTIYARWPEVTP